MLIIKYLNYNVQVEILKEEYQIEQIAENFIKEDEFDTIYGKYSN